MTYVVWTHKNGRTYKRRIRTDQQWVIPQNCVRFQWVSEDTNAGVWAKA